MLYYWFLEFICLLFMWCVVGGIYMYNIVRCYVYVIFFKRYIIFVYIFNWFIYLLLIIYDKEEEIKWFIFYREVEIIEYGIYVYKLLEIFY